MPWACGAIHAGDSESADTSRVVNLHEVEVVATRADAATPIAFTNVAAKQLERNNDGLDIPYLLQFTPSLITTSDTGMGMGYSSMRVRGTDGSRINVTINGVPMNEPDSHQVYWVDIPDITSSVKDIQVQRGAGTSTNGAGAFGASVNVATIAAQINPYAELSGSYGMYNTNKETLRVGTGLLGDHWSVDARISHLGTDGYIDRAWAKMWSYYGQVGYYNGGTALKLLAFGGKEQTYMAWDYASKEDMTRYGRRYNPCGQYTDDQGNIAYYPNQTDNYAQHRFQLALNQVLTPNFKLNATLFYTKGDGHYEQYKTRRTLTEYGLSDFEMVNPDGTISTVSKSDLVRLKKMDNGFGGGIFDLTYKQGRVNAVLGGGLNNYKGHHWGQVIWVRNYVGPLNPMQEYYRNVAEKLDFNIYARANVAIWNGLSGYADLQYRYIDFKINGMSDNYDWNTLGMQPIDVHEKYNFFNPKVGFNYNFHDIHRAYASLAVAHREPVRDNFIDCEPGHTPKAERLLDWELGYEFNSRIFTAGVNLYYMDYKDQLLPTGQLSDTGNPVSVNVPDSYRMGLELMWKLKPLSWFDWDFTATLSRNRVKNFVEYIYEDEWTNPISFELGDTPIAFSPDFTFHNTFNFNLRGFNASLASQFVSKQYLTNAGNDEASLDSYFVTDLRLGYTFKKVAGLKEVFLGFTIYNLFNEEYENNGYAGAGYYKDEAGQNVIYRYSGYAAQAPTHVMGTVTIKF